MTTYRFEVSERDVVSRRFSEGLVALSLPEVHVVAGDAEAAAALVPVIEAMRQAGLVEPVFLGAGSAYGEIDLRPDLALEEGPLTGLIPALDALWATRMPVAVLVADADPAGMAAALAAAWRGLPIAHLGAGVRDDDEDRPDGRMITQVASLHLVALPVSAMNLLDEGVPASDLLITGDDTLAPRRAAQAVAALAGLTLRPAPMPVTVLPATVRFGG